MNDQQRAAMQMALEALEDSRNLVAEYINRSETNEKAITALREALQEHALQTLSDIHQQIEQPQGEPVKYVTEPQNLLPNGLTLLQTNPDCAVQLNSGRDFGWLYMKGADGQWVTHRKLSPEEINEAQDQADDMVVVKRESVLEKMFAAPISAPPSVEAAIEANDDDTDKALELVWHMQSQIDVAVKAAIEATKEKAAKVCEEMYNSPDFNDAYIEAADAIRSMK